MQLKTTERKDTHQMADMERIGARIEADVAADRWIGGEAFVEARGHIVDETSLGEVAEQLRG